MTELCNNVATPAKVYYTTTAQQQNTTPGANVQHPGTPVQMYATPQGTQVVNSPQGVIQINRQGGVQSTHTLLPAGTIIQGNNVISGNMVRSVAQPGIVVRGGLAPGTIVKGVQYHNTRGGLQTTSRGGIVHLQSSRGGIVQVQPTRGGIMQGTATRGGIVQVQSTRSGIMQGTATRGGIVQVQSTRGGIMQGTATRGGIVQVQSTRGGIVHGTATRGGIVQVATSTGGILQVQQSRGGILHNTTRGGIMQVAASRGGMMQTTLSQSRPAIIQSGVTMVPGTASNGGVVNIPQRVESSASASDEHIPRTTAAETLSVIDPVPQPPVPQPPVQAQQLDYSPPSEPSDPVVEEPAIDIIISNVVCSFSTRCHLNLKNIAMHGSNVIYKRENSMVTMKLRKPSCTASIWSSGKITCTGATSNEDAHRGARRIARLLQGIGFKTRFSNFRVVNVLGTCSFPFGIKITHFSNNHKKDASYEPEIHPGVTYKIASPKATLKIFSTGSITVTAPSVANVQSAIEFIYPLVEVFKTEKIVKAPPQKLHYMPKHRNPIQHNRSYMYDSDEESDMEYYGSSDEGDYDSMDDDSEDY